MCGTNSGASVPGTASLTSGGAAVSIPGRTVGSLVGDSVVSVASVVLVLHTVVLVVTSTVSFKVDVGAHSISLSGAIPLPNSMTGTLSSVTVVV